MACRTSDPPGTRRSATIGEDSLLMDSLRFDSYALRALSLTSIGVIGALALVGLAVSSVAVGRADNHYAVVAGAVGLGLSAAAAVMAVAATELRRRLIYDLTWQAGDPASDIRIGEAVHILEML